MGRHQVRRDVLKPVVELSIPGSQFLLIAVVKLLHGSKLARA
jgi:hypothetical protein